MKLHLTALGAGLLVGVIYSLLNIRSPAPPVVALVGLLGILLGEQLLPLARRIWAGQALSVSVVVEDCRHHVLGPLPGRAPAPDNNHG
jgi:XapX domain-containing protein